MKILIIGGNSSLGKSLKSALFEFAEVITAGRENCDIKLDLNDPFESFEFPSDLDFVVHTAADFGGRTVKEMLNTENINVLGTLKLCHKAINSRAKHFIYISSISSLLNEDSKYYSIYSLSKKHSEEIAKLVCNAQSLPLTILRPSQIYGSSDSFRTHQPIFYMMADKAQLNENILIYGSNDARRNYIHINDLTKIIIQVIKKKVPGTFSCMHTVDLTLSQIANAAILAFNSKSKVLFLKDKGDIPDNIFPHDNSLYLKIGTMPKITIEEGFQGIAAYRK